MKSSRGVAASRKLCFGLQTAVSMLTSSSRRGPAVGWLLNQLLRRCWEGDGRVVDAGTDLMATPSPVTCEGTAFTRSTSTSSLRQKRYRRWVLALRLGSSQDSPLSEPHLVEGATQGT